MVLGCFSCYKKTHFIDSFPRELGCCSCYKKIHLIHSLPMVLIDLLTPSNSCFVAKVTQKKIMSFFFDRHSCIEVAIFLSRARALGWKTNSCVIRRFFCKVCSTLLDFLTLPWIRGDFFFARFAVPC